jgi:pimeloyl-ACP methyl ester carboxylesterase
MTITATKLYSLEKTFYAKWNRDNIHLKDPVETRAQRVAKVAWDLLSIVCFPIGIARAIGWAIRFFAKGLILPSTWSFSEETVHHTRKAFLKFCKQIHKSYAVERKIVTTPDGVGLNVFHYRHHLSDEKTPTVILFHSNGSYAQQGIYSWLIHEAIQRGTVCNFVAFNYRGVIDSEGEAEQIHHLQIDGDAVYQFVRQKTPPEQIHFYGWSLGGAVATNVKALNPERCGKLVNVRSLESTAKVVNARIPSFLKPFFFWVPWAVRQQGWDLRAPFEKVKGPVLVVYHKKDSTIPFEASAYKAAKAAKIAFQELELKGKEKGDHHVEPLHHYERADLAIADFLLEPASDLHSAIRVDQNIRFEAHPKLAG